MLPLVGLDHGDVVRAFDFDEPLHVVLNRVEGIEGDHCRGQVQGREQRFEMSSLVRLRSDLGLGDGDRDEVRLLPRAGGGVSGRTGPIP
jgi:hypothetical protein